MTNKIGLAVLQIATIVFFLNATFAYGACCLPTPTSNDVASEKMPCHHEDEMTEKTVHADDCCLMCVSMTGPTDTARYFAPTTHLLNMQSVTPFLASDCGIFCVSWTKPYQYQLRNIETPLSRSLAHRCKCYF